MEYIAHSSGTNSEQTLKDHLFNTALLSEKFSIEELKKICYCLGLLHDIGKYQDGFQSRIRGGNITIEHAICGALEIQRITGGKNPIELLMQLCIAGHHTGIPNCGSVVESTSLKYRLNTADCQDYSAYKDEVGEVQLPDATYFNQYLMHGSDISDPSEIIEKFAFVTRYCFSCLTDADSIDTIRFFETKKTVDLSTDFYKCREMLQYKLSSFQIQTKIQKARSEMGKQALKNLDDSEIFLMNMPTGSGKTLTSMQCALNLAIEHNLKRIIYVIPYNSIIDQTAAVFENIFHNAGTIVRHQSSFSYEEVEGLDEEHVYSIKRACENWDADIIITTAVQFFESLYGNKRGKLRKVHNMSNAVIVFDEAHLMPREYLQPCLRGIGYISRLLQSKILFLTATMPNYKKLLHTYALPDLAIKDIITDKSDFQYFKKAEYMNLGSVSDINIVSQISMSPTCLVVMNTRKGARKLYSLCSGKKYHLSTYMTGIDRENTISTIHRELNMLYEKYPDVSLVPPEERIVVISTSLIEAGVDLDFVDAYRELSGLDNILQTGGRCNREGKRNNGHVYVFNLEAEKQFLKANQSVTLRIFEDFKDVTAQEAIEAYYEQFLFTEKDNFEKHAVSAHCSSFDTIDFKTYSEEFNIIDGSRVVSIVVTRDKFSSDILESLRQTKCINPRALQRYCCSLYKHEFEELMQQGVLEDYGSGIYFLVNLDYYDTETGIQFEGKDYFL